MPVSDSKEIKSRLLITYRQMTPELHDLLESMGEIAQYFTHIRLIVLECDPAQGEINKGVLIVSPDVEAVEFDRHVDNVLRSLPSDFATAPFNNKLIYDAVRAPEAWEIQKGRPDVVIGVSDTGVDMLHPDLIGVFEDGFMLDTTYQPGVTMYDTPPHALRLDQAFPSSIGRYCNIVDKAGWVDAGTEEIVPVYADRERTTLLPDLIQITANMAPIWVNQEVSVRIYTTGTSGLTAAKAGYCRTKMHDYDGHGTIVTGIIASKHNTGEGIQGIAPNCKIRAIQNMHVPQDLSWSGSVPVAIAGLTYAQTEQVDVVNCSWGGPFGSLVTSAANTAANSGVIVVVGSGNTSANSSTKDPMTQPDDALNVITVSGTGVNGDYTRKADFAVRHDNVFISAPATGFGITPPRNYNRNTGANVSAASGRLGRYSWGRMPWDGTSFSTPLVSGAIGLMLSEAKDRGRVLTSSDVKQILKDSANPTVKYSTGTALYDTTTLNANGRPVGGMGFGVLDITRALRAVQYGIDVRLGDFAAGPTVINLANSLYVDVRTWGPGIQAVEIYIDDVLNQTLTPGGTQYSSTLNLTFASPGNKKVHVIARDTNGSVSTSTPRYIAVESAVKPVVGAVRYSSKDDVNVFDLPVVIYSDGIFHAKLTSTKYQPLSLTKLEVYVDGALKQTFNGPFTIDAPNSNPRQFTLNMTGITAGFHVFELKLYAGAVVTTQTLNMVHAPNSATPAVYTLPYTYDSNGYLRLKWFATGDISASNGTPDQYSNKLAISRIYVLFDGAYYLDNSGLWAYLDGYGEEIFYVKKPSLVQMQVRFENYDYYGPDDEVTPLGSPHVYVTSTLTEAIGNAPSADKSAPVTYSTRSDGWFPHGYQTGIKAYDETVTIKYRWADEPSWSTYSGPIQLRSGTLEWYGQDAAGNTEFVQSAAYEVAPPPPGSIAAAAVSLTPLVATPSLAGISVGSIAAPSVSLRPSVSTATLSGVQVGSMSVPAVTLRPSVAVGTLSGIEAVSVGSIAAASTTMQIQVNSPTLRGVTAGTAIRAPDGTAWDLRDIYGAPLDIRAVA